MTRAILFAWLSLAAVGCTKNLEVFGADHAPELDAATTPDAGLPSCAACMSDGLCVVDRCVPRATLLALAAGDQHACAIKAGVLSCWGDNASAQLANADTQVHAAPLRVGTDGDWFEVAAGDRHTCGLRSPGKLFCWGDGSHGQLGTGATRSRNSPVRVGRFQDFSAVACGGDACCALRAGGHLLCWGDNSQGSVGVAGTAAIVSSPTAVAADATFNVVRVAAAHSCAVRSDGALLCWGRNLDGELGTGMPSARSVPTRVGDETGWVAVAVGAAHSCGLRQGRLFCWGGNEYGQVGLGREGPDNVPLVFNAPAAVTMNSDWLEVAAGAFHNCARRPGSQLYCWGRGDLGELGAGVVDVSDMPTLVPDAQNFRRLALGSGFSCAFDADRSFYCWGDNSRGQLGVGDTSERDQPALVAL